MRKPCIDCGILADGTRCLSCKVKHDRPRNVERHARRAHYQGDYKARRARLRRESQAANAPCWICGDAIDWQAGPTDPWSFQADHVVPRSPSSPLAPSHRHCNAARARAERPAERRDPPGPVFGGA